MRIVAALGGNALARKGESFSPEQQIANVRLAAGALAELVRDGHDLIITHGNGPQVGLLAAGSDAPPLDVVGAQTEGMIGYWIEREISNQLPEHPVATLLTQVEVDRDDPAFDDPGKPIGRVLTEREVESIRATQEPIDFVSVAEGFRRVVASPIPRRILEMHTIELLVDAGVLVVCAGGGGIPVTRDDDGILRGSEGVIDKDSASALLAEGLEADFLLLLTDVPAIFEDWPSPAARPIRRATPAELGKSEFERGSMQPKVEAACRFVADSERRAAIGALDDAARIVRGEAGTLVCRADDAR